MPVHFLHHQLSQKVPLCKVHERGGHSADGQVELICYRTGQPSVADIKSATNKGKHLAKGQKRSFKTSVTKHWSSHCWSGRSGP